MVTTDERAQASKNNLIWHYTSPEGLNGILNGHILWATSATFMNDFHELHSGIRALRSYVKRVKHFLTDSEHHLIQTRIEEAVVEAHYVYILSGSLDGDSLTMWRNYGKHTVSYSIGLDRSVPLIPLQNANAGYLAADQTHLSNTTLSRQMLIVADPNDPVADCLEGNSTQWLPVAYKGKKRKEIVERAYGEVLRERNPRVPEVNWLSNLLLVKAPGFRDELEERITYSLIAPERKFLSYRSTPWGIAPYAKLTAAHQQYVHGSTFGGSGDDFAHEASPLPIRHIRIGPTPYRKAARRALEQILHHNGYVDVEISTSKIPYR